MLNTGQHLAVIRRIVDLFVRWYGFSYPVPAATLAGESFRDTGTHDFRRCPHCGKFLRVVPCRVTDHCHCPACGATPYLRTPRGCIWYEKLGSFATHSKAFELTAPLHDPFKNWAIALIIIASSALLFFTDLTHTAADRSLSWMTGLESTVLAYGFVAFVVTITCLRATFELFQKGSTEHAPVAYVALLALAIVILVYGLLHTQ